MEFFTHLKNMTELSNIHLARADDVIIVVINFACFPAAFTAVLVCGVQFSNAAAWVLNISLSIWSNLNSQNQEKVVLFFSYVFILELFNCT